MASSVPPLLLSYVPPKPVSTLTSARLHKRRYSPPPSEVGGSCHEERGRCTRELSRAQPVVGSPSSASPRWTFSAPSQEVHYATPRGSLTLPAPARSKTLLEHVSDWQRQGQPALPMHGPCKATLDVPSYPSCDDHQPFPGVALPAQSLSISLPIPRTPRTPTSPSPRIPSLSPRLSVVSYSASYVRKPTADARQGSATAPTSITHLPASFVHCPAPSNVAKLVASSSVDVDSTSVNPVLHQAKETQKETGLEPCEEPEKEPLSDIAKVRAGLEEITAALRRMNANNRALATQLELVAVQTAERLVDQRLEHRRSETRNQSLEAEVSRATELEECAVQTAAKLMGEAQACVDTQEQVASISRTSHCELQAEAGRSMLNKTGFAEVRALSCEQLAQAHREDSSLVSTDKHIEMLRAELDMHVRAAVRVASELSQAEERAAKIHFEAVGQVQINFPSPRIAAPETTREAVVVGLGPMALTSTPRTPAAASGRALMHPFS